MTWEELPDYARLLISTAVGVVFMILVLVLLCQCLWLCKKRKQEGKGTGTQGRGSEMEVADIAPHRHLPKMNGSHKDKWKSESLRSKTSLSSSGSEGYGSLKSVQQTSKQRKQKRSSSQTSAELPPLDEIQFLHVPDKTQEPGTLGSIQFSLSYAEVGEILTIRVMSVRNLRTRPLGGLPHAYVKVTLRRSGIEKPDFEYQTNVQTKTVNPNFHQTFDAAAEGTSLSMYTLRLVVCDHHRLGQADIIGEAEVRLKGLDWRESVEMEMALNPSTQMPFGEVLISLSYLPTSERLYITVLRTIGFSNVNEPFVRVSLVFLSKNLQKRRIASTQQRHTLVFDEAIFFEVPRDKLGRVHVLVVAMETRERGGGDPDAGGAPAETELGRILLGRNCPHNAHAHWEEILLMPRIQIAQWYPIYQAH